MCLEAVEERGGAGGSSGGWGVILLRDSWGESQILTLENHLCDNNYLTLSLLVHFSSLHLPVLPACSLSFFALTFLCLSFAPVILATSDKSNPASFLLFDTH